MSDLGDKVLGALQKGYHCSQTMMQLSLELRELSNPLLIRAMGGLGQGMFSSETCGALTGAACAIASYFPRNEGEGEPTAYHAPVNELVAWFKDQFGSLKCLELVENDREQMRRFCPGLMEKCFAKIEALLEDHGIDSTQ
jgi:C_GCAxxG_C_C family probable redox protein